MKTNHIAKLLLLPLLFAACQEVVVNKYEDNPCLYFSRADSLAYSFYFEESSRLRDTLWIEVCLSGLPRPEARPLPIVQIPAGDNNAVAGQHYVSLDDPEIKDLVILPPGAAKVNIPVILLRDPTLKTAGRRLLLDIATNEHFGAGIQGYTRLLVHFSDLTEQPANWTSVWRLVFGDWGAVKMRFIIDYVGVSNFDVPAMTGDTRDYLKARAKQKLAEYETANGPLYEADNITRVRFPN
ncbi:MAG: DUF4843 domain-containing protein [Odoribacteraceae bacterium]|jgi:hypothetical protein|nr:DUF4843 domain-containing protein [Odoribacteraceae bacterium]